MSEAARLLVSVCVADEKDYAPPCGQSPKAMRRRSDRTWAELIEVKESALEYILLLLAHIGSYRTFNKPAPDLC